MIIETNPLIEVAETFRKIGERLATHDKVHEQEVIELGGELIETAAVFRSLCPDDYIDSEDYTGSDREMLVDNFINLSAIAQAGASADHRTTPLMQVVGEVVDELGISDFCNLAFERLAPIAKSLFQE